MALSKAVLVTYNGSNKVVKILSATSEFEYLRKECKKLFKFGKPGYYFPKIRSRLGRYGRHR